MGRISHRSAAFVALVGISALVVGLSADGSGAATAPTYQFASRDSGALPGRVFSAAAGDADGESVVVYGGEVPGGATSTIFSDTWVYEPGSGWEAKCGSTAPGATAPCGPGPRSSGAMGRASTGAVLFGGSETGIDGGDAPLSDTWVWKNGAWTQTCASGACGPSGRVFPGLGGNGTDVVLFGGLSATGLPDDTWVFDGETWTQTCGSGLPTSCGVPGLLGPTIGWDGREFVMFGGAPMGASDIGAPTDDTWTFDGTSWTQVCGTSIAKPCGPAPRALAAMAWQRHGISTLEGAVLAGGGTLFGGAGQRLERDAWFWRDGGWTQLSTPWPATTVTFTDDDQPAVGSGPLVPVLAAQPSRCEVLFVGQNPVLDADFAVAPQTYSGGWDLDGTGQPTGCRTEPAATPATDPVPETVAAVPAATTPVHESVAAAPSSAAMARTGRGSDRLAVIGLLAIVIGLGAVACARPRRSPAEPRIPS